MEQKRRLGRANVAKLDAVAFESMLDEHLVGHQQAWADMARAIGAAFGQPALAKALSDCITRYDRPRTRVAETLLDAAWRAVAQRGDGKAGAGT